MFFSAIEHHILHEQFFLEFFSNDFCLKQSNHSHYFQELR